MSGKNVSRRKFIHEASAGAAAAVTAGTVGAYGNVVKKADTLAVFGGSPVRTEPFPAWPQTTVDIEESLVLAFRSGKWGRTLGERRHGAGQVGSFEKRFAQLIGAKHCLATGSCTQALHTALHSVGVGAGDEVLVTPCTYLASIQAVLLSSALPVFVDVDIDTFQMVPAKIEPLVDANTRAVEPVHIGGIPCSMEKLMAVATTNCPRKAYGFPNMPFLATRTSWMTLPMPWRRSTTIRTNSPSCKFTVANGSDHNRWNRADK